MLGTLLFQRAGEHRHEGRVERAFGKQPAEQVGEAKGGVEGIGHRTGAEYRRQQRVAHEAKDSGEQGEPADGEEIAVEGQTPIPTSPLGGEVDAQCRVRGEQRPPRLPQHPSPGPSDHPLP